MTKIVQNSFLGGQLDFEMMGRQDVEKYSKGATTLKNFLPLKRGAIRKRPGTDLRHVVTARITASAGGYRLVPFAYREDEGWALLFTDGAILAFSSSQTVEVAADNATFYGGDQLAELDYCQSGDVMFIAHQDHPPCRIEHVVEDGVHAFTLREMDFNLQKLGVPEISAATVTKQKVLDIGGTVTEIYKATAVYDGVETCPGVAFGGGSADDDGTSDWETWKGEDVHTSKNSSHAAYVPAQVSYSGTTYHAPWTKSQVIELSVPLPHRTVGGSVQYPEQLRFYRKSGSFFGLVGFLNLDSSNVSAAYSNANVGGEGKCAQDAPWRTEVHELTSAAPLTVTFQQDVVSAKVRLRFGKLEASVSGDVCTVTATGLSYTGATTAYRSFRARLGDGSRTNAVAERKSPNVVTWTYQRGTGESDADLVSRSVGDVNARHANELPFQTMTVDVAKAGGATTLTVDTGRETYPLYVNGYEVVKCVYSESGTYKWKDEYYTPDVSITPPKEEDVMSGPGDWPACVCLSQQRLIWASTRNDPARIMMSQVGDFYVYQPHDAPVDDDAVDFQVSATRFPKIGHLVEMRKLLMFNGDAEWVVDSASASSGITYATIQARQHSSIGAAAWLKPIVCNNVLLFAEKTGQAVRRYGYQLEDDGFGGVDVSIFSASMFRDRKIVSWAFQKHPNSTCWCVLSDGTLASLTFMPEQQTVAWAAHELGGGGKARQVVCTEAVVGNAGAVADTSQVFLLVERGGTWTLEEMRCGSRHGSDSVANSLCLDSARTLAAGQARRSGSVAVDPATGKVYDSSYQSAAGRIEGFVFESVFESVHPVVANDVGLAQMDVKCVQEVHLRLADAVGGTVRGFMVPRGQASRLVNTVATVEAGTMYHATVDENVPLVTDNNRDGRVAVEQSEPWPFTLLMLETDVEAEESERRR